MIRTYSELIKLPTFEERFEYLKIGGKVGMETFGSDRYLNQRFYFSNIWKKVRREIILRDQACDLAMPGYELNAALYIHHMNPITAQDFVDNTEYLLNPEYLICVSRQTHEAIHYGNRDPNFLYPKERTPNDTCPWK